jgi:hypothetical protein
MVYWVSEGTSHAFGVYVERLNRTTNVRVTINSTQTFDLVDRTFDKWNQFILILYDFIPINTPPPSFILCIFAHLSLCYSSESVWECFGERKAFLL